MLYKKCESGAYYVLSEAGDHCVAFRCLPDIELVFLLTKIRVIIMRMYRGHKQFICLYIYNLILLVCAYNIFYTVYMVVHTYVIVLLAAVTSKSYMLSLYISSSEKVTVYSHVSDRDAMTVNSADTALGATPGSVGEPSIV